MLGLEITTLASFVSIFAFDLDENVTICGVLSGSSLSMSENDEDGSSLLLPHKTE